MEEIEHEKTTRSKETIENLQTLIRELTYIEEMNNDLTKQLEKEQANSKSMQIELDTNRQLVEQLTVKVARLEKDNMEMESKTRKNLSDVYPLVRKEPDSISFV